VTLIKRLLKWAALALAALVVLCAAFIAWTWAPDKPLDALKPRWAQAPSQFIAADGLQAHLRDEGPRDSTLTPIVLLHGTSASLHTWDGWAQELAKTRRVLRFDLPGFGLTGPRADADYSIAAYVRFVIAMLDAKSIDRCVLVGNSLGGHIAWATAAAHPGRVERLVLVDASGYALRNPGTRSVPMGFRIAASPVLAPVMQNTLPRFVIESSLRNVYGDPAKVTPELIDRYYELTLRQGNRRAVAQRMQRGFVASDVAAIKSIAQPTLILWGERDRLTPLEFAHNFKRDIARSTLVVLPGLGHVPHEEDPAASVAVVQRFLSAPFTLSSYSQE
jgi:pimeloyl-ACP methyl ester carboxylesterase